MTCEDCEKIQNIALNKNISETTCELCNYEDEASICKWCYESKIQEERQRIREEIEKILKDEFAFSVCDQSEECQEHKKELDKKFKALLEEKK